MIIPAGFGQCTLNFTGTSLPQGAAVVFGFANAGPQDAEACRIDIATAWYNTIREQMCDSVIQSSQLVKLGPNDDGPTAAGVGTGAGLLTGSAAPPQVSWLVSKRTALGGRRNRGRMYIPGIPETSVSPFGSIDPTLRQNMEDECDAFLAAIDAAGCPMVILHNTVGTPTLVQSLTVSASVATQRNRLRR